MGCLSYNYNKCMYKMLKKRQVTQTLLSNRIKLKQKLRKVLTTERG